MRNYFLLLIPTIGLLVGCGSNTEKTTQQPAVQNESATSKNTTTAVNPSAAVENLSNSPTEILPHEPKTPDIWIAAAQGNVDDVRHYLKSDSSLLNRPDEKGLAPLHKAALAGRIETVTFLLDSGAKINVRVTTFQGTPLQYAAAYGHLEVARLLVDRKANVNAKDTRGRTPLDWADLKGHAQIVQLLRPLTNESASAVTTKEPTRSTKPLAPAPEPKQSDTLPAGRTPYKPTLQQASPRESLKFIKGDAKTIESDAPDFLVGEQGQLVTLIRPVVANLHIQDAFRVALHWEPSTGPLKGNNHTPSWFPRATLSSLKFKITTPDEKTMVLQAEAKGADTWNYGFYYRPTLLITLNEKGISTPRGFNGNWSKGKSDLHREGLYRITISGALMFGASGKGEREDPRYPPVPFETSEIAFFKSKARKPLSSIRQKAREKLGERFKVKEFLAPGFRTESGMVSGMVTEDPSGSLYVHFAGETINWGFKHYIANVDPNGKVLGLREKYVGTCVAEGTKVRTRRGLVAVEEVRIGDHVQGYDLTSRKCTFNHVEMVRRSRATKSMQIIGSLRLTGAHPVYTAEGWKPASQLNSSDKVFTDALRFEMGTHAIIEEQVDVYDLAVSGTHNFFAGGILVHNKDRAYSPALDDPWYFFWPKQVEKQQ